MKTLILITLLIIPTTYANQFTEKVKEFNEYFAIWEECIGDRDLYLSKEERWDAADKCKEGTYKVEGFGIEPTGDLYLDQFNEDEAILKKELENCRDDECKSMINENLENLNQELRSYESDDNCIGEVLGEEESRDIMIRCELYEKEFSDYKDPVLKELERERIDCNSAECNVNVLADITDREEELTDEYFAEYEIFPSQVYRRFNPTEEPDSWKDPITKELSVEWYECSSDECKTSVQEDLDKRREELSEEGELGPNFDKELTLINRKWESCESDVCKEQFDEEHDERREEMTAEKEQEDSLKKEKELTSKGKRDKMDLEE